MNIFTIESNTTYGAVEMLRLFVNMPGVRFKRVALNVKPQIVESIDSEDWAVRFTCNSINFDIQDFEIRVKTFTCGYQGTGPHDLIEALKITGFGDLINEDEILHTQWLCKVIEK